MKSVLLLSHLCLRQLKDTKRMWGVAHPVNRGLGLWFVSPKMETHQNYSTKVQLTHLTLAIPSHSVWAIGLGILITQKVHADHVESAYKLYEWYVLGTFLFGAGHFPVVESLDVHCDTIPVSVDVYLCCIVLFYEFSWSIPSTCNQSPCTASGMALLSLLFIMQLRTQIDFSHSRENSKPRVLCSAVSVDIIIHNTFFITCSSWLWVCYMRQCTCWITMECLSTNLL